MKKMLYISTLAVFIIAFSLIANAGEALIGGKITLKSPDGKAFTTTIDKSGRFQFKDLDCDGDGYIFEIQTNGAVFQTANRDKIRFTSVTTTSEGTSKVVSPRDHASGLPTGKRMHKPFIYKSTMCSDGKGNDCDDTSDKISIEIKSDGSTIQGMAIKEQGMPAVKK